MKAVSEHADNLLELVMAYWDDKDEVKKRLCDYVAALRREVWIEAREKMTEKKRVRQLQDAVNQVIPAVPIGDINAAFNHMLEEK